jgi:hypothetical protein
VAITRAKELLTIGVPLPKPGLGRDALPTAMPSRFVKEMKLEPTEQILQSATYDADALAESLQEHGASQGLLNHLRRYVADDPQLLKVIQSYKGEIWPMRPLKLKK